MTTFDEAECLKTNPFEGDFGEPGDKVLKDFEVPYQKWRGILK